MGIMTVGIDLAKNVLAVHGGDEKGKAALVKPTDDTRGGTQSTKSLPLLAS